MRNYNFENNVCPKRIIMSNQLNLTQNTCHVTDSKRNEQSLTEGSYSVT